MRMLLVCFTLGGLLLPAVLHGAEGPSATPVDQLVVKEGFQAELLYSVPKETQGSWVNMCVDPQGRLIVSDQYGKLYRVTPPGIGEQAEIRVEPIPVDLGEAQGLLWAFDSLYVVVNRGQKYDYGLYRVRDTDGDDVLDNVEQLREFAKGGREHGPHAVLLSPDGESLYVVAGNQTPLPEIDASRVPQIWGEDLLLPRTYGRGFMKGTPAPGGWICRVSPDGDHWELVAVGFRNEYDAAFNRHGDLFTYDADMEWDINTPWYRPTRVCHVVSGAEFGWRNGSGKWPPYYPDSVPPALEIGPGSPTGVAFGYGARFPKKYQQALFLCDWSYGKLYAMHVEPQGASYGGEAEEFITGTPLPLTDIVINPTDGAMYFTIGGRKTQSGLYRVTYTGAEPTEPAEVQVNAAAAEARELRRELEAFHGKEDPQAVEAAWPHLGDDDRFIRWAARVAIEHQPLDQWKERALAETDPQASLEALLALVRVGGTPKTMPGSEIDPPPPTYPVEERLASPSEQKLQSQVVEALGRLEWKTLDLDQKLALLRVYQVAFARLGAPTEAIRQETIDRLSPHYPADDRQLNAELATIMVYLQAPGAAEKTVHLLRKAPTREEQIEYAKALRFLRTGWTPELREQYFAWFNRAVAYRGGASFELFVEHIKNDALAGLSEEQKAALKPILEAKPQPEEIAESEEQREFVKDWTVEQLAPAVENDMHGRDFEQGRAMFAAAKCFACHRFDGRGGAVGPDLTALSGRFSPRDILESVIEPSKEISDQYQAVNIYTTDGRVVTGRIVNLSGDTLRVNTNMLAPGALVGVNRNEVEEMVPSRVSMMPQGLLNTLDREEVLDLMAYLLARGNPDHPYFAAEGESE